MRHGDKVAKLSRNTSHRKALLRNLASSLFKYENIKTTVEKAKALRPYAEKLITKAKNDTITAKRIVYQNIRDRSVLKKLFEDIAARYKNRNGGYTRIYKLGQRTSDGSEMAIIELVEESLTKSPPSAETAPVQASEENAPVKKTSKTGRKTTSKPASKSTSGKKSEKSEKQSKEAPASDSPSTEVS